MSCATRVVCILLLCAVALSRNTGEWSLVEKSHPKETIPISFQFKIRNEDWLKETFEQVSDPTHPSWRQFVSRETLREMTAPGEIIVNKVAQTLTKRGMISYELSATGDFMITEWTVEKAEEFLGVSFHKYRNENTHAIIHRSQKEYQLPAILSHLIQTLGMVNEFPAVHLGSRTGGSRVDPPPQSTGYGNCSSQLSYGYPTSSDTDLYSQVMVICCNGNATKDLDNPCSDEGGPTFLAFKGEVYNNVTGLLVESFETSYTDVKDQCSLGNDGVTCNILFTPDTQLQPYGNYWMTVQGLYADSVSGDTSVFPVPLITSPFVTPQLFAKYYDIPSDFTALYNENNTQSVVEFDGQFYSPSDLHRFLSGMSVPESPVEVVGKNRPLFPGDEATLDIEWIMASGTNIKTIFWMTTFPRYLLEWTNEMLANPDAPLVSSISYGGGQADSPAVYTSSVDLQFQKMGILGLSVVVSSGDAGATNIGHGTQSCDLTPQYPAASPYVTSVSATFFTPSDIPMCSISYFGKQIHCSDAHLGEVAVSADIGMDWTTGGGFSIDVPRPSYQENAVSSYLQNNAQKLPPANTFNSTNRGYPDVSATGHNLVLILRDEMDVGDGTSASAPIFSGILAMVNQYLLSVGEPPIGFANPLLYLLSSEHPDSFYDVTVGGNKCGDVLHPPYVACCDYGFQSARGWDPVTGLGTPRFSAMINGVKDLISRGQYPIEPTTTTN